MNPEELGPKMVQGCIQYGCTKVRGQGEGKNELDMKIFIPACNLLLPLSLPPSFPQICQCCNTKKSRERNPSADGLIQEGVYTNFDTASTLSGDSDVFSGKEEEEEEESVPYHTIVIDCAPIGFADSMGVAMLEQV